MKQHRALAAAMVGAIIILVAILLFFRGGSGEGNGGPEDGSPSGRESGTGNPSDPEQRPASKRLAAGQGARKEARPLEELLDTLIGELKSLEAERISLLTEGRRGPSTIYLLAAPPPSGEEIQRVRTLISSLQKNCHGKDREKLDARVKELLDDYDAFGQQGQRVIIIQVEDEGKDNVFGFIMTTTNFDEMKRQFDAEEPLKGGGQLSGYSPLDGMALKRFSAMMTHD